MRSPARRLPTIAVKFSFTRKIPISPPCRRRSPGKLRTVFPTLPSGTACRISSLPSFPARSHKGGEDSREHNEDEDLFASLYEDFRASAPTTETDSSIVFGIENGQWTLLSLDEDLLYSYYGLAAPKAE